MIVPRFLSGKTNFIPLTATCVFNCPLSGCWPSGVYYTQLTLESYPLRNVRSGVNTTPFFAITKPQSWRGCRLVQNCTVIFFSSSDLCGARVRCKYKNIAKVAIWRSHEFWWIRYSYLCVYRSNPWTSNAQNSKFWAAFAWMNDSLHLFQFPT